MVQASTTIPSASGESADIVARLRRVMIEHSLPLWSREGWDSARGGFVEQLDSGGRADVSATRRVRVQARQIYCYAKAAHLGWYSEGREIALMGVEYLLAKADSPDGRPGFVHTLTSDGTALNPMRDTYDHAFVLLALASVYQLTGDAQIRAAIDKLTLLLATHFRSPHGGYLEGLPPAIPRRQNPHMHLFGAMIATFDATGDPAFQNFAGDLFSLFIASFYDKSTKVIGEYFEDDWSKITPVCVEPGHLTEWVWLLKGFERITGCPTGRHRADLLASALRYGDASGCLVDEGDAYGNIRRCNRRLWPQTEIAKAWIAQAEAGEPGAADQARAALVRLDRHYLRHPVRGGWYDQFDGNGRSTVATIPASSFYHVLCAIVEADRVVT